MRKYDSSGGAGEGCRVASCLLVTHCQPSPPTVPENELSKCLFSLKQDRFAYFSESFFNIFLEQFELMSLMGSGGNVCMVL